MNWTTKENNHIDVFCRVLLWCRQFSLSNASPVFLPSVAAILFFFSIAPSSSAYSGSADNYPSVTLWPLAYHYQDESRSRTDILYPFFHYKREGTHERFAIRPFLYNLEKDPTRGFLQLNVLWPLSHFESEGDRFKRYLFPFYYHSRNGSEFSFHAWPFYGHSLHADGTESWSTIYPFFQYQRNEKDGISQYDYLWPLGRSVKKAKSSSSYLFPLWWSSLKPGQRGRFIFPYFMYETNSSRQDAILPVWYRMRTDGEKRDFLLLWYAHDKENYHFRTFFPLYWDFKKGEDRKLSLFVPFYGHYRSQQNDYQGLFPFYFRHTNIELASEFRYYFPLYGYYRKGEEVRHSYYLFPVYAYIEDDTIGREAWYFLWPLVYREVRPGYRETWVVPFYWSKQTPARKFRAALLPPYYSFEEKDGRKEVHFWPFYGLMQDQSYLERSVAWPLFRWGTDPSGDRRAWQFLLAYRKVEPQRDMLGVFPLWHYDRNEDRVRNVSLLHWQEKSDEAEQFSLLHAANPDWSIFSIKKDESERHHHLFPFYSYMEDDAVGKKDFYILGPIYRYRVENGSAISHQFLWKVLYHEKSAEKRESGFLWRLIRSKEDEKGRLFEFNPFYYREIRANGDSYSSWLGGVYSVRNELEERKHTIFWFINW